MLSRALTPSDPLVALRYVDVALVIAAAPLVAVAGLPMLGYCVAAVAWTLQRMIAVTIDNRARGVEDLRRAVGLNVTALFVRVFLVGAAIVTVGVAGDRADGRIAAIVCLLAFTAYFASTLLMRSLDKMETR